MIEGQHEGATRTKTQLGNTRAAQAGSAWSFPAWNDLHRVFRCAYLARPQMPLQHTNSTEGEISGKGTKRPHSANKTHIGCLYWGYVFRGYILPCMISQRVGVYIIPRHIKPPHTRKYTPPNICPVLIHDPYIFIYTNIYNIDYQYIYISIKK